MERLDVGTENTDPAELWLQVAANPSDESLKKRYVDSLPPGDERAEPMRLSAQIKDLSWGDERTALEKKYNESLVFFQKEMKEIEDATGGKIGFHKGWPCLLSIDAATFIQAAHYICSGLPVRHLQLKNVDTAPKVFEQTELQKMVSLSLNSQPISHKTIKALTESPNTTSLRWLSLTKTGITDGDIDALAAAPSLRALDYLGLEHNPGTDPVDLTMGYGTDGISGYICPESIFLPERGKELQSKYGKLPWLWIVERFNGLRPNQLDV